MHIGYTVTGVMIMAEFCLDCWNKRNDTHDTKKDWVISKELDLCEECGQYKHVIVKRRKKFFEFLPVRIFLFLIYILLHVILFPYFIYDYVRNRKGRS